MQKLWKCILDYCDWRKPEVIAYLLPGIDLELGERLGLLTPMTQTEGLFCREPCGGESLLSTFRDKDGSTGYGILCSECGATRIDVSELRRWRIHAAELGHLFAKAAKIQGEMTPIMDDQAWHLGRRGNHPYIFVRYAGDYQFIALVALLKQHPKATVVTSTSKFMTELQNQLPNRVIALELSATLQEDGTMTIDESAFEEIKTESAKQPRKRRGERTAKIELCELAMKDHVFAAYDYMLDTANRGEIKLLPRPSQEMLGKMTKLSQKEVSRCLKDKEAKILRLLWEKSCTLDGIESLARMFRN
jgi:hypothetical protein